MAETHIVGSLLGRALGDAIGLPYEGLSPRRAQRMLGPPDRHRFLLEWPRSAAWIERLGAQAAECLESRRAARAVRLPALGVPARNLFFLCAGLGHGFRRLLPP
jgi:hypothetical protein